MKVRTLDDCIEANRPTLRNPVRKDRFLTDIAARHSSHRFLANAVQGVYMRQVRFLTALLNWRFNRPTSSIRTLDWGCGKGHISHLLREQGFSVTSVDIESSEPDSAFTQETPILNQLGVRPTPLRHPVQLPFEDASFDCVTSFGVLEHVEDDLASMTEIRRILAKGGVFYVTFLPNRFSWTQAVSRLFGDNYHNRLYTRGRILDLASDTGFHVAALWRAQLLPKNIVPFAFDPLLEPIDRVLCRSPLGIFATNFELVLIAE